MPGVGICAPSRYTASKAQREKNALAEVGNAKDVGYFLEHQNSESLWRRNTFDEVWELLVNSTRVRTGMHTPGLTNSTRTVGNAYAAVASPITIA